VVELQYGEFAFVVKAIKLTPRNSTTGRGGPSVLLIGRPLDHDIDEAVRTGTRGSGSGRGWTVPDLADVQRCFQDSARPGRWPRP